MKTLFLDKVLPLSLLNLDASLASIQLSSLAMDSRELQSGGLFFAVSGRGHDGRAYLKDAIEKGAVVVLCEGPTEQCNWQNKIPVITMPHLRSQIGELASKFYDEPTKAIKTIGVTGTNGKSSIAYSLSQALCSLDKPCGMVGTVGWGLPGNLAVSDFTTPGPIVLQGQIAAMREQGAQYLAMEVSSHALDQARVSGICYDVGILTNITRDHFDYHGSMAQYAQAKLSLFENYCRGTAIINSDDPMVASLINRLPSHLKKLTISCHDPSADIYAKTLQCSLAGLDIQVMTPWGEIACQAGLLGRFNANNLLAVLASLLVLGVPLKKAAQSLAQLPTVPGRMQIISGSSDQPKVIVDYAHTPDALEKALTEIKYLCKGRLVCVFGCGGDRDVGKRAMMGEVASSLSDYVIITNDNPRSESPQSIAREILGGVSEKVPSVVIYDRKQAIHQAICHASSSDVILIAGKGHESTQTIGENILPFDDVVCAKTCLSMPVRGG